MIRQLVTAATPDDSRWTAQYLLAAGREGDAGVTTDIDGPISDIGEYPDLGLMG